MRKVLAILGFVPALIMAIAALRGLGLGVLSMLTNHTAYGFSYGLFTAVFGFFFGIGCLLLIRWCMRTLRTAPGRNDVRSR